MIRTREQLQAIVDQPYPLDGCHGDYVGQSPVEKQLAQQCLDLLAKTDNRCTCWRCMGFKTDPYDDVHLN